MDQFMQVVEDSSPQDWIAVLPADQQEEIRSLLEEHSEEETAQIWVQSHTQRRMLHAAEGDIPEDKLFPRIKKEFNKFICSHSDYAKETEDLNNKLEGSEAAAEIIVNFIANAIVVAIAKALGIDPQPLLPIMMPVISVLIRFVKKVGLNVYCSTRVSEDNIATAE